LQCAPGKKELHMTDISEREASRNNEFDIKRSTCILLAKTSVLAYVDDNGDLWIYASDSALCVDTELRIAADDVLDFVDRLTELVGIPAVGRAKPDAAKTANAERQRRHRAKKRNAVTPETVTGVTGRNGGDDQPALDWSAA
jgi:hypothetical protein